MRTFVRRVLALVTVLCCVGVLGGQSATAASVPATFTLSGSGFGHGVGMPQYGAYAQALAARPPSTILKSYYTGVSIQWRTTPTTLAVQVFGPEPYGYAPGRYSDERTSTRLTVSGGSWRLRSSGGATLASGSGTTSLAVSSSSAGLAVTVGGRTYSGKLLRLHWSGTRYYAAGGPAALVRIDGAAGVYRHGRMTMQAIGGKVNVVNDVLLNTEYLYGVAEMPSSWGSKTTGALSVQAIAARSYAMTKPWNNRCGCNVVDDVRDQVFTGWSKENEGTSGSWGKLWKKGVDATNRSSSEAIVMTYGGKPVAAHYFSSSGGRTENSEAVWTSAIPYERGVADPWTAQAPGNSYASWTRTITQAKAAALFGLPDVATIAVTARHGGGTMRTVTATSSNGTVKSLTGSSDSLRSKIGAATSTGSLPSAWVRGISAS
ncbi:SpoIID/LytB domain-containing protein [Cellulosimicrobium cellulans]|uniref:SpoIID/LytB domain-containing protein n=1 Tax=Cellulosimicrobium cellulans TaxID=1710 RepID=UPI0036ED2689